ncbi:putative bifunctional diguanylate cyclase/phosphodiesterase [Neorhizobium galegae]|uniref:putative bifunctional diguanylate cyclase/phosphodiesterase n=1 Tax=Neorhizobium galegae TaxID=399 RepID=UPI000621F0CC|nr:EAL domain-containing protein [Neorhizobium galegae]KAB1124093.1 EAL domain-containing protein [Neorhizobium galegae]MCQ1806561.1 EAL domain-containing protein [Neorhizobium galegae]CDZ56494.1 Putative sensory box/GGDEF family protein (Nitrogen fixation positive activator protein-like protein) [Neorhizobium galegae bv. orientalis]
MRLLPSRFRRSATLGRRSAVTSMLLAFAVVVVLVTIFILTALDRIADYANRLDDERSRETTSGAIQTFQEQLHATLNDYAAWDDAAQFVYAGDDAWVVGNYGDMTANSDLFDVALIMDTDRNVLMAYQDGAPVTWSPQNYFDTSLWTLFDKASSAGAETVPEAVGFVETKNGIAAVGVALIRQKSGELAQPVEGRRFLIFGRHLDERKILKLSETYVIGGLRFAGAGDRVPNMVEIRNIHGKALQRLVWNSRMPGNAAYLQVRPLVYCALAMVGLFFLLLFVSGSNTLNRLTADEAAARHLAMSDRLSGLLNRAGFFAALDALVLQSRRSNEDVALLYLDLDGFKEVNDAYGHGTGDKLIRGVAAGLKTLVGETAILARVGGDEFAIALAATDIGRAVETLSDHILGFFGEPFVIGERVATIGTCIGVAISPRGKVSGEELVRRSDMAMYHAKETGRGRTEYYRPEMDAEREDRNMLEIDLRIAIERREVNVVYQPVVDARTWRIIGVEALARWHRTGYGPVSPDVFIPIAESTGLIDQLGLFVLHRACETLTLWPELKLAVNISPGQFRDPAFAVHVASVFRKTGADPSRITLEMTEGYFIQNPERARAALAKLKQLGVKIALDDFGAGFSSVGYLRQFGFDRMKIDKSLVHALEEGGRAVDLLQATVALARSLEIPVTAEGVETEAQAIQLRLTGCDELQGYMFGKPMSSQEIDIIYRGNRLPGGMSGAA